MSVKEINTESETDSPSPKSKFENNTLSVIIRSHKEERLPFLDEALFSLAIQYWQNLEVVVALQNGTEKFKYEVNKLIEKQPFHKDCKFQVHNVEIPPGVDGRSTLINHGIKNATGRYLAFLDDDDVVYQHGYKTLIEQLVAGEAVIAAGGCRTAKVKKDFGNWYIQAKETPFIWGRNRLDLLKDNFIPIHSYVIDRTRVDESDLYFDDELPPLEDYDFLLRLNSKYEFDFSKLDTFVCEYRLHGANSIPYGQDSSADVVDKYARAFQLINKRKNDISFSLPVSDLLTLLELKTNSQISQPEAAGDLDIKFVDAENPRVIQKILDSTGNNIYEFFSRHPKIERQLSKTVHYGWRVFTKFSSRNSDNNQN